MRLFCERKQRFSRKFERSANFWNKMRIFRAKRDACWKLKFDFCERSELPIESEFQLSSSYLNQFLASEASYFFKKMNSDILTASEARRQKCDFKLRRKTEN